MRVLIAEKLSPHKYKTPEGYLICQDAILARTGKQTYLNREVYGDSIDNPDKEIEIDRPEAEVFSDKTLASFENKPVTIEHPDEDVNIDNHNFYSVGFVRDIKRGIDNGKPVMIGTLVVTNPDAVADIENGKLLELSCGYDCDIVDNAQTNIRGNHVALCEHGRAGNARIIDSTTSFRKDMIKVEKSMNLYDNDLSCYRAGIIDSKFKDFDDTTKNIRVVKEFIEQNGNKFDKRKDADAILDYIEKRTGIVNADYGDVLYIIKEYTRAKITDSVKDVSELEFDNILDLFERKGIDYSDADYELKYIWFRNNAMYDKAVQELRHQRYSFNEAINKRGVKLLKLDAVKDMIDCDTNDEQVKDDEKTILFELLTKYGFKILRQGKTWSGRTHIEFTGDFFDEDDKLRVFSEAKKKIDRLDSEAARAGLRMTFNIGLGKDRVVGSIDSEPMHDSTYSEVTNELKSELKDENLFTQKVLKAIKTIKMIK